MGNYNTHRNRASTTTTATSSDSSITSSENTSSTVETGNTSATEDNNSSSPLSRRRAPRRLIFIYDFELPGRNRRSQNPTSTDSIEETSSTETTNAPIEDDLYLGNLFNEPGSLEDNQMDTDEDTSSIIPPPSSSSSSLSSLEHQQQEQQEAQNEDQQQEQQEGSLSTTSTDAINAIADEINSELSSLNLSEDLPPLEPTSSPPSSPPPPNPNSIPTSILPQSSSPPRMRVWIEVSPSSLGLSSLFLDNNNNNNTSTSLSESSTAPQQITGHVIFVQVLPSGYTDPVSPEDDLQQFLNHTFQLHASNMRGGNPPASQEAIDALEKVEPERVRGYKESQPQCTICYSEYEEEEGEEVVKMECGHLYHKGCIGNWLKEKNTCPLCRWEIGTEDVEYEKDRVKRMEERRVKKVGMEGSEESGSGGSSSSSGGVENVVEGM